MTISYCICSSAGVNVNCHQHGWQNIQTANRRLYFSHLCQPCDDPLSMFDETEGYTSLISESREQKICPQNACGKPMKLVGFFYNEN